ncbi:GTP-dependent nucleic acid-binding protein EngD, partial [human gut metagenome]
EYARYRTRKCQSCVFSQFLCHQGAHFFQACWGVDARTGCGNLKGRVEKVARTQKDKDSVAEFHVLQKIKPVLENGLSARTIEFDEEEQKIVKKL